MRTTLDTDDILNSNSATYEIELTVRDRNGASDTDRVVLFVEKCPVRDQQDDDESTTIERTITENTLLMTSQGQPITF